MTVNLLPLNASQPSSPSPSSVATRTSGVMSGGGSSQVSPAGGNPVPPPPELAKNPMTAFMLVEVYHRSAPLKGIQEKRRSAIVKFDSGHRPRIGCSTRQIIDRWQSCLPCNTLQKAWTSRISHFPTIRMP